MAPFRRRHFFARFQRPSLSARTERALNLLVSRILTERIHRPDRCGNPADQRDLQDQADDARNRAADREKLKLGQNQGEQQTHFDFL
jgi:hypothetical protein